MSTLIIILIIVISILLVLAVLAQNAKGGGLSSQFTGAGSGQLMGVKKTSDLLEQITWGLAITLIVLTLSTSFLMVDSNADGINSVNIERAQERAAPLPQQTTPATPDNNTATPPVTAPSDSAQ